RPKPNLAERLRRLDVDERIRMELDSREPRPIFASRLLEAMLRPIFEDAGRLLQSLLGRLGLAGVADLERKLRATRPDIGVVQFFGEKITTALVGLLVFPAIELLAVHPFG